MLNAYTLSKLHNKYSKNTKKYNRNVDLLSIKVERTKCRLYSIL